MISLISRNMRFASIGFDWRLVRTIGKLHILNRASAVLLFLVPPVAALWPTIAEVLRVRTGDELQLPTSIALLFLAAVSTLLGRTIFELVCPDRVALNSLDEYVRSIRRDFAEAPSAQAIHSALAVLANEEGAKQHVQEELAAEAALDEEENSLKGQIQGAENRYAEAMRDQAERSHFGDANDHAFRSAENTLRDLHDRYNRFRERDRGDRGPAYRRRVALVEAAAAAAYLNDARSSKISLFLCIGAYAISVYCVGRVIVRQLFQVFEAAGWHL